MKHSGLFLLALILTVTSFAQVRKIPAAVTQAFTRQYPNAQDVEYHDQLTSYHVNFTQDSSRMEAHYSNKGDWKETNREWSYDKLPSEVKDGLQKSKYATDWKVTAADIIYEPRNRETYRLKVEKNDVQKKYLYFDKSGRLLRDAITL